MNRQTARGFRPACEGLESRQLLSTNYLVNAFSGKVADDPGFSKVNGTQIIEYQPNGGSNQQWNIIKVIHLNQKGSVTYEIQNAYSGQYLQASGAKVVQNPKDWKSDQEWVFMPVGSQDLIMNTSDGLVLNVSSTANGSPLNLAAPLFLPNIGWLQSERWTLAPVEAPQIEVQTTLNQLGGGILVAGQGFTPNSEVDFYAEGLVGQSHPLALGSIYTAADGTFQNFGYEAWIWSPYQTGPATIVAIDRVTGRQATGQTWAFSA
jgi:hypothetical protein